MSDGLLIIAELGAAVLLALHAYKVGRRKSFDITREEEEERIAKEVDRRVRKRISNAYLVGVYGDADGKVFFMKGGVRLEMKDIRTLEDIERSENNFVIHEDFLDCQYTHNKTGVHTLTWRVHERRMSMLEELISQQKVAKEEINA